jgi:lambda family phage portal protein
MFKLFSAKKRKQAAVIPVPRQRHYAAAKMDRLTESWRGITGSADSGVQMTLTRLRARSRQLAADNDYARRFYKLLRSNVVGAQGISMQVRAIESDSKKGIIFDDSANRLIEKNWNEWASKKHCTIDGRLSFIDVQQMLIETVAKDGEILVRKIRGRTAGNPFAFTIQLLEADHLDENYSMTMKNGNRVRMGIEYNEWNRPVAYHVLTRHPGDTLGIAASADKYERIPAEDMLHLYVSERPSQSRGVPWMVSAMRRMRMLGTYEENELVAAGVAASKMGFFTSADGEQYKGTDEDADGNLITEAEPGLFEQLPAGVKFESWDPQHPTTSFGAFIKAMLRGAASGIGVSYTTLSNDLEGVSYSSIRQGTLEERDMWRLMQTWMIEHFCTDIFESWLLMALTTQKITLPLSKFEKFNAPVWRPRGWSWVDPLKEVKSNIEAVNAGFMSAQDVASQQGMDIEDVYAQLALEKSLREKHGVVLGAPDLQGLQAVLNMGEEDEK